MASNFDLLGDPIPEGYGGRGRPEHIATVENCNKIRLLLAFEWTQERIAKALRITPKTLRKHYSRELRLADEARPALEMAMIFTTFSEALNGNASMMKEARKLLEKNDIEQLDVSRERHGNPRVAPKLGKKEQALADAKAPDVTTSMGELIAQRLAGQRAN